MTTKACSICGESHEGHETNFGFTLPDEVSAMPQEKRNREVEFNTDLCKWGSRYFIRSILKVSLINNDDYFGWGVWVEVDKNGFEAYQKTYDKDGSNEPRLHGTLANKVPGYIDSLGCAIELQFGTIDTRPTVHFNENVTCKLAKEQRQGISPNRYHQILTLLKLKYL